MPLISAVPHTLCCGQHKSCKLKFLNNKVLTCFRMRCGPVFYTVILLSNYLGNNHPDTFRSQWPFLFRRLSLKLSSAHSLSLKLSSAHSHEFQLQHQKRSVLSLMDSAMQIWKRHKLKSVELILQLL